MAKSLKEILARQIHLTSQVIEAADEADSFKQNCSLMKSETEKLAEFISQIAQERIKYDRPFLRIFDEVEQVLDKVLSLILRCRTNRIMDRFLLIIPSASFTKVLQALETCIENVRWLLSMYIFNDQGTSLAFPSILTNDPVLWGIWSSIAMLYDSSQQNPIDTLQELLSICHDDDRRKNLIIEEGGLVPLFKLLKDGQIEEQEIAAMLIGTLGCDFESIEKIIDSGVFLVFAKILKEGPMKIQAEVASAISELASVHPKCQDICVQNNIIRPLINHLCFDTIHEHVQNFIPINKATSVLAIVKATSNSNKQNTNYNDDEDEKYSNDHKASLSPGTTSFENRESEDPDAVSYRKAMAARALWQLVKGNTSICRIITESKALLSFTILLKQGSEDVRYPSIMALMEITAVAEQDTDLRRSVFKPSSPAWKAIIDELCRNIEKDMHYSFLIPSIKAIANLARTFQVTHIKIISSLVELLSSSKSEVVMEALIALEKFCKRENHLHVDNSKAIISVGGVRRLVGLVDIGESTIASSSALVVLRCIATDVPRSQELVVGGVHSLLQFAPTFRPNHK